MSTRFFIPRIDPGSLPAIPSPASLKSWDYADAFALIATGPNHPASEWLSAMFLHAPAWIRFLMRLRHALVAPFGLKRSAMERRLILPTPEDIKPGLKLGLFEIYCAERNFGLMGANDRHLDFRVGIWTEALPGNRQQIRLATWVKLHHSGGRFYFAFVKPFHRRIVPAMLRSAAKGLALQAYGSGDFIPPLKA